MTTIALATRRLVQLLLLLEWMEEEPIRTRITRRQSGKERRERRWRRRLETRGDRL